MKEAWGPLELKQMFSVTQQQPFDCGEGHGEHSVEKKNTANVQKAKI